MGLAFSTHGRDEKCREELLVRTRRRWEDDIRMDLGEIHWEHVHWMNLTQERVQWRAPVNTVMNLRVPQKAGYFLNSCVTVSFSRRAPFNGVS
jgi:hypothetical protein